MVFTLQCIKSPRLIVKKIKIPKLYLLKFLFCFVLKDLRYVREFSFLMSSLDFVDAHSPWKML